ncbi:hypothetical protein CVD28_05095 [Bacillus sp. M6-12]|uniref:hypothetical protein n=1 Tax=Bacillus sp. M6-12 TaxID=2054166 RepID=UPI000C759A2E|nr:hypothetical protein [Bacillus sp. M6-12]PLS18518.1 hypothetical protein CVD28_05095 [Bacillus sp. M6-12]
MIVLSNINITPASKISSDLATIFLSGTLEAKNPLVPLTNPLSFEKLCGTYSNGSQQVFISYNQNLYSTINKMYRVQYKFKLIAIEEAEDQVTFVSDFIDDTYLFKVNNQGEIISFKVQEAFKVTEYMKQ